MRPAAAGFLRAHHAKGPRVANQERRPSEVLTESHAAGQSSKK